MKAVTRLGILVGMVGLFAALNAGAASSRPNFILCMSDDQGWGDMGYMGDLDLKTPVFDEMARTGLRFDHFYAAHPVCSPTRGSVLTGRHPNRYGCFSWGHTIRPQEITIAEALKTAGYTTGHFGKWHVGSVRPDSPVNPAHSGFDEWLSSPNFYENDVLMCHNGEVIQTQGEGSHMTVDYALQWIRKVNESDKPFLAIIWFGSPHSPHVGYPEYLEMYKDLPKERANFCAEITAMDHAMGVLREEIRKLNIQNNTVLLFTSDNGAIPQGSTGGLRGKKGNLYEGGLRVPAILEWPARIESPRTTNVRCNTEDIYPTVLDIAGVHMEKQPVLDGISLVPLIDGRMKVRPQPMGFWVHPTPGIRTPSADYLAEQLAEQEGRAPHTPAPDLLAGRIRTIYSKVDIPGSAAWIDGDFKLHRVAGKNGKLTYELYDLSKDDEEKHNIIQDNAGRADTMKAALNEWLKSVVGSLNGEDY